MSADVHRDALSALPSPAARALAFVAIVVAGIFGGLIGFGFMRLTGSSDTTAAIVGYLTAVAAALGTAVVSVLALRAMGEWRQLGDAPSR